MSNLQQTPEERHAEETRQMWENLELPVRLRAIAETIDENSYMHPIGAKVDVLAAADEIEQLHACSGELASLLGGALAHTPPEYYEPVIAALKKARESADNSRKHGYIRE